MVMVFREEIEFEASPLLDTHTLKLSWHEDMIGALPVFNSYKSALTYAGGDAGIVLPLTYKKVGKDD